MDANEWGRLDLGEGGAQDRNAEVEAVGGQHPGQWVQTDAERGHVETPLRSEVFDGDVAPAAASAAAPAGFAEARVVVVDFQRDVAGGAEFRGDGVRVVLRMPHRREVDLGDEDVVDPGGDGRLGPDAADAEAVPVSEAPPGQEPLGIASPGEQGRLVRCHRLGRGRRVLDAETDRVAFAIDLDVEDVRYGV